LLPATSRRLPPVGWAKPPGTAACPTVSLVTVALGTARDRDHRLDRRLSNTRLCPTSPCPGQPLVSTEIIIREPWVPRRHGERYVYPLHVKISPRCMPLAPDSGVATSRKRTRGCWYLSEGDRLRGIFRADKARQGGIAGLFRRAATRSARKRATIEP